MREWQFVCWDVSRGKNIILQTKTIEKGHRKLLNPSGFLLHQWSSKILAASFWWWGCKTALWRWNEGGGGNSNHPGGVISAGCWWILVMILVVSWTLSILYITYLDSKLKIIRLLLRETVLILFPENLNVSFSRP